MSLINDALKRAQQDKLNTLAKAPPAAPLEPACEPTCEPVCEPVCEPACEPVSEPACKPVSEPACEPANGPSPRKWMMGAAAAVLVGGMAWWFFAEVKSDLPAPAAAVPLAEPALVITEDARAAYALAGEAFDQFDTIIREAPVRFRSLASAGRKAREAEARAADEARAKEQARLAAEARAAEEARVKAEALAAAKARDAAKSLASQYKLGGVMKADGGTVAIINGLFLREGQTVDGATIIRIEQHTVELDVDGKRIILRM
jgi:hypothetical protein